METNEYKQTEIGEIPKDWEVVKLGDIVNYDLGRTPARKENNFWTNGNIPWVSIADMKDNIKIYFTKEMITDYALKKVFRGRLVKKGTLLMSFKLTIGRTAFLGIDATHNEAIISIYPKKNASDNYLYYYLPSIDYSLYKDRAIKGNTLNKSKLNKILIPLPPLQEQEKIAYVLSTIQEAQEKTENYIKAFKEFKKSVMSYLFKYGAISKNEIDKVELKQTEIGEIPKDWEVVKLGDIVNYDLGRTPARKENNFW
ncbi:MAG: restriction endonuclease subunit S, partial [Candidatus Woesearchaeota archaeon]